MYDKQPNILIGGTNNDANKRFAAFFKANAAFFCARGVQGETSLKNAIQLRFGGGGRVVPYPEKRLVFAPSFYVDPFTDYMSGYAVEVREDELVSAVLPPSAPRSIACLFAVTGRIFSSNTKAAITAGVSYLISKKMWTDENHEEGAKSTLRVEPLRASEQVISVLRHPDNVYVHYLYIRVANTSYDGEMKCGDAAIVMQASRRGFMSDVIVPAAKLILEKIIKLAHDPVLVWSASTNHIENLATRGLWAYHGCYRHDLNREGPVVMRSNIDGSLLLLSDSHWSNASDMMLSEARADGIIKRISAATCTTDDIISLDSAPSLVAEPPSDVVTEFRNVTFHYCLNPDVDDAAHPHIATAKAFEHTLHYLPLEPIEGKAAVELHPAASVLFIPTPRFEEMDNNAFFAYYRCIPLEGTELQCIIPFSNMSRIARCIGLLMDNGYDMAEVDADKESRHVFIAAKKLLMAAAAPKE